MHVERFGFVGLPNAGKSSLYNALAGGGALAAPYAFATVDPNVGVAKVPDDRLMRLAEMSRPRPSSRRACSSSTSPGSWRVRPRARGSATASWPTSARSTPSCSSCGPSTTSTCPARPPRRTALDPRGRAGLRRPRDAREAVEKRRKAARVDKSLADEVAAMDAAIDALQTARRSTEPPRPEIRALLKAATSC